MFISHQITRRCQKCLVEKNFERDQKCIQQSDFLINAPEKGDLVTPCMDVYKEKDQSDGSLDKLKLRIVVRGDFQNK